MRSDLSDELVRGLAVEGATDEDICELYGLTRAQLLSNFGHVLKEARAHRRVLLRKLQNKEAQKGNTTILALLGKNELGQDRRDRSGDDRWPEPQLGPKVG